MAPEPTPPTPLTPQATCESGGGRWNADMTCTSAADIEAQAIATAQDAAEAAYAAAKATLAEVEANKGSDVASYTRAEIALADAMAANEAARAATTVEGAEAAQAAAETAQANAARYAMMVTAAFEADEVERMA